MKPDQNYNGLAPDASDEARKEWQQEHDSGGFTCAHCGAFVAISESMGTLNRNHCNTCLWSKHVDQAKGDRKAACGGDMEPIGLTFKHEGEGRVGEIMLIHRCTVCQKISINRIARDDPEDTIMSVYRQSLGLPNDLKQHLSQEDVYMLNEADSRAVQTQLFGKSPE